MTYTDNWEELEERYEAWWNGSLSKGPILKVFTLDSAPVPEGSASQPYQIQPLSYSEARLKALQSGMSPAPYYVGLGNEASSEILRRYWLDVPTRLQLFQSAVSSVRCLGDAFLHFFPDFGSTMMAIFIGAEPIFGNRSMLNGPLPVETLEEIEPYIQLDPENRWWQATLDLIRAASEAFGDKIVVGFPNLGGALDILASLRGTQNLLMDLILNPDTVKRLETKLSQLWIRYFEELYAIIRESGQEGTTSWVGVWGQGKTYPIQCDVAYMISSDMFQEFAVPSLRIQASALDHCLFHYHREGPRETLALDYLLDMDEIDAIQWTCEPDDPPQDDESWLPLYRRVTERGKGLLLDEVRPERVGWLVANLPAERLAMNVVCKSKEEAHELLSKYGAA